MTTSTRPLTFYPVPGQSQWRPCRCGVRMYWPVDARFPIDCDVEGGARPTFSTGSDGQVVWQPGRGVNHFATCPLRDQFRRRRA